jgi:RNase P protein component
MQFQRWTPPPKPDKQAAPHNMQVGQVVIRRNVTRAYRRRIERLMMAAMRDCGMEFSVGESGKRWAVRRDK